MLYNLSMERKNDNIQTLIERVKQKDICVDDEKRLSKYIRNYNFNNAFKPYLRVFKDCDDKYIKGLTSNHVLNLYDFDKRVGFLFLEAILELEQILNTNIAYSTIKQYNLPDGCLFKIDKNKIKREVFNELKVDYPRIDHETLISKLTKFCGLNSKTREYENFSKNNVYQKWKDCPLDVMCLSWSFSTTVMTFCAVNINVKSRILDNFRMQKNDLEFFKKFLKECLFVRNKISHNDIVFDTKLLDENNEIIRYYDRTFKESKQFITLLDFARLLDHLTFTDFNLHGNIIEEFKKMQMPKDIKSFLIKKIETPNE